MLTQLACFLDTLTEPRSKPSQGQSPPFSTEGHYLEGNLLSCQAHLGGPRMTRRTISRKARPTPRSRRHGVALHGDQTGHRIASSSAGRPWMSVAKFMGSVIAGDASWQFLSSDCNEVPAPKTAWSSQATSTDPRRGSNPSQPSETAVEATMSKQRGKKDRKTYKLTIAYAGHAFHGWAWQPDEGHISTSEELRRRLRAVFPPPNALILESAGRTDSGVHGHCHAASFYSWDAVSPEAVCQEYPELACITCLKSHRPVQELLWGQPLRAINQPQPLPGDPAHPACLPDSLRCISCQVVPRSFHATFACQWRRYMYLLPLTEEDAHHYRLHRQSDQPNTSHNGKATHGSSGPEWAAIAEGVHSMLSWLQGQQLDYYAFGRSTPKGRNSVCTMLHASAKLLYMPQPLDAPASWKAAVCLRSSTPGDKDEFGVLYQSEAANAPSNQKVPVVCIQLIADRYLRRMVRTLVATAVMSAIWDEPTRLKDALHSRERRDTAYSAPATGLCFTGAGYDGQPPTPLDI